MRAGETRIAPLLKRYCKRGHLRTLETTFERKCRHKGVAYVVRECRICHSMRNSGTPKIAPASTSKWKRRMVELEGQ